MGSKWKITSQHICGARMYAVYRVKDINRTLCSSNMEMGSEYMEDENEVQLIADKLNKREELYLEKKSFVEDKLENLLKSADISVSVLEYTKDETEEFVWVGFDNGYNERICVTGDSLIAIVSDVIHSLS